MKTPYHINIRIRPYIR